MLLSENEFARLPSELQALFRKRDNPGKSEVLAAFPWSHAGAANPNLKRHASGKLGTFADGGGQPKISIGDSGSAARFFYSSKASKADRALSKHPTVKPVKLMQWLVRLITPPGGTVLDCFAGTGTTGEAAWREGFSAVLIEREEEYIQDIERRMLFARAKPKAERAPPVERAVDDIDTLLLPLDTLALEALPLESTVASQATIGAE